MPTLKSYSRKLKELKQPVFVLLVWNCASFVFPQFYLLLFHKLRLFLYRNNASFWNLPKRSAA